MIQLVYCSTSTQHWGTDQLFDMLIQSRLYNRRNHLTGILLYCNRQFIQVLEGPEEQVNTLFERISLDIRHKDCRILLKNNISARSFEEWEMGFKRLSCLNFGAFKGYSKFFEKGFTRRDEFEFYEKVMEYLTQFKHMNLDG